jgi:hypothetical protein
MECQFEKNEHFRHLLLFAFNQGSKAAKAARDICAVYGEGAIAKRTARDWYANWYTAVLRAWLDKFFESKSGDFYQRGIENLVERWEEVVNNKGEYIID